MNEEILKKCKFDLEQKIYNDINHHNENKLVYAENLSLSHGYPGLIIFFTREKNRNLVEFLKKIVITNLNKKVSVDLSLFSGLSGIGFSFLYSQQIFKFHDQLVKQIDNIIFNNIKRFISIYLNSPSSSNSFDVIQGLSGICQYLSCVIRTNYDDKCTVKKYIVIIIKALEKISYLHPKQYKDWWISSKNQFLREEKIIYSSGNYNLGMAHGILGPISLFIGLYKLNILDKDDIKYLNKWIYELISFKRYDNNKPLFWPRESPEDNSHVPSKYFIDRNGWCYGNSIISYVLFSYSKQFHSENIRQLSINLLNSVVTKDNSELKSSIICHGKAGLLMILKKINNDFYSDESLLNQIYNLKKKIVNDYSDNNVYGFIDESSPIINGYHINNNKVGLLEGTSGILLSLMDQDDSLIPWYAPFMLN